MSGDLGEVRSVLDVDAVVANVILFQQGTELAASTPGYFPGETPAVLGFLRVRAQRAQAG